MTQDVKLRLFVQNQIKISFLQRSDGDLIKIADAKFPNNPFIEIEKFLSRKMDVNKQLLKIKENSQIIQKRQNFAAFFIEAYLEKKLGEMFYWNIQKNKKNLLIKINKINKKMDEFSFEVDLEQEMKNQINLQLKQIY